MNLSLLDRGHLEAILLDPPAVPTDHVMPTALTSVGALPPPVGERDTRLRHALAAAHELLVRIASQAIVGRPLLNSPTLVKDFLKIMFAGAERETFVAVFLDAHMRVIATEELFAGTLTQTSVYPREVVRRALYHNAAAVICAHPHPCGGTESPFKSRSGRVLLYMWNTSTGEHAYYDVNADVFLNNEEAAAALATC